MLNLRDLRIDPACLGEKMLLVEVVPAYEYKDNKRTDKITGYRYVVCLVEHRLEKLSVRIDGPQLMESPDSFVEVLFSDTVTQCIMWVTVLFFMFSEVARVQPFSILDLVHCG